MEYDSEKDSYESEEEIIIQPSRQQTPTMMDAQFGLDFDIVPSNNLMTQEKTKILAARKGLPVEDDPVPMKKTKTDLSKEAAARHKAGIIQKKVPVLSVSAKRVT